MIIVVVGWVGSLMAKWRKSGAVILGAIVLSTIGIQASDLTRDIRGNLLGSLTTTVDLCPSGSILLNISSGTICVDQYEASASTECPKPNPDNAQETQENLNQTTCKANTAAGVYPWRYVSLTQAQQLCARAGKRLPTAAEWYALAASQSEQINCVLNSSSPARTGVSNCTNVNNISDLVGNLWEWVDAQIVDATYEQRQLPESGYVSAVDQQGIVLSTSQEPAQEYGHDYAKTNPNGVYGMIRGGFYGSQSDGGIFAQNLAVPLDLKTAGVGFRCVSGKN